MRRGRNTHPDAPRFVVFPRLDVVHVYHLSVLRVAVLNLTSLHSYTVNSRSRSHTGPANKKKLRQRRTGTISKKKIPAAVLVNVKVDLLSRAIRVFLLRWGIRTDATRPFLFHV